MATRQKSGSRNELIHCDNCGEDYSATYKRCPFCDEEAAGNTGSRRGRGGKRLSNSRGGGYGGGWGPVRIVTTVISIALIIAAAAIVFTIVKPLVELGSKEPGTSVSDTPAVTEQPSAQPSDGSETAPPDESASPTVPVTASPSQTAQSFTLSVSDITLDHAGQTYPIKAAFSPAGTTGDLTWNSSNPACVSVDESGTVTAVASGTATITATLSGGSSQTCIIRCKWSDGSTATTSGATLNRTDMTLSKAGETFTLKVNGTSSTPKWITSNSSVATVSSAGKVTAVASGTATITATVDGQTLKCIVRCNF